MIHHCSELLIERKEYMRGIPIVSKSILRLRKNESQLTASHADLCHVSICCNFCYVEMCDQT